MAKREWGAKHICADCGVKFYDLHRRPVTCPKCGSMVEIETVRSNRRRPSAPPERPPAATEDATEDAEVAGAAVETAGDDSDDSVDDIDEDDTDLVEGFGDAEAARPAT